MVRKVFVTGASGFIGRSLMRHYRERGAEVCGMDLRANPEWSVVAGDLLDPRSWSGTVKACDLVVHTAALVSTTPTMDDAWRANVLGTRHVIDAAIAGGAQRFVHVSSVATFGYRFPDGVEEKEPTRTVGYPYVDTKITSEHTVLMAHGSGEIDCTIIRPADVYGPGSRPWVIEPIQMMKAGKFMLPAHGKGIFSPVHIDDLVDGVDRAATNPAGAGHVFTISGTEKPTCAEFFGYHARWLGKKNVPSVSTGTATMLANIVGGLTRMLGKPSELGRNTIDLLARPGGYSIEKARRLVGYEPRVKLADGMAGVEKWCREQRLI
jgi:nucleoside-diphosphate-sugar epimerase